jgi:hypothetical protein
MSDPERNPMFSRRWAEPEKRQRPAPVAKSQPPQSSLSNKQSLRNSRSTAATPRRKQRRPPSLKLIKIGHRLLDPRPRP